MDMVIKHFEKVDSAIYQLILKHPITPLTKSDDLLKSLCHGIIGQQLSNKVAKVIFDRFMELFPTGKLDTEILVNLGDERLRHVGMSYAKARTLGDLGQKIIDGVVELNQFESLDNDQVITELVKVKGIGPWTAEMFLMFSLGREDVFSGGDYGLRKAVQRLYELPQMPSSKQAIEIALKWAPYRSYACLVLWKSLDN